MFNFHAIMVIVPIFPSISNFPRWIKINNSIFPYTSSTSIVIWNNNSSYTIGSNLGYPKFTNYIRNISYVPSFHLSVLVGLLLSDAGLSKQNKSKNARLGFKQSMIHFPFFWSTFMILSHYCMSIPYSDNATINGKKYYGIRMDSRAYACFSILYDMFYSEDKTVSRKGIINRKKIVPSSEDIYHLLSPIALAYWIMGDGLGNIWKGLYLCTDSFSNYDTVRLMNVLLIRYKIKSSLVKVSGKSRIYIPSTESIKISILVSDYIHPSMQYKILGNYPINKKDNKV
jgi:hypothetical protein